MEAIECDIQMTKQGRLILVLVLVFFFFFFFCVLVCFLYKLTIMTMLIYIVA